MNELDLKADLKTNESGKETSIKTASSLVGQPAFAKLPSVVAKNAFKRQDSKTNGCYAELEEVQAAIRKDKGLYMILATWFVQTSLCYSMHRRSAPLDSSFHY